LIQWRTRLGSDTFREIIPEARHTRNLANSVVVAMAVRKRIECSTYGFNLVKRANLGMIALQGRLGMVTEGLRSLIF
jgi:hypothetical protein